MTDAEVICTFMEPRPATGPVRVDGTWWSGTIPWVGGHPRPKLTEWKPVEITAARLRQVEDKLNDEQWLAYTFATVDAQDLERHIKAMVSVLTSAQSLAAKLPTAV